MPGNSGTPKQSLIPTQTHSARLDSAQLDQNQALTKVFGAGFERKEKTQLLIIQCTQRNL